MGYPVRTRFRYRSRRTASREEGACPQKDRGRPRSYTVAENFFAEQKEQSQIKTAIVTNYFWSWANVITGYQKGEGKDPKIAYIDLFAGPGRYEDGAVSTPLLILKEA